METRKAIVRFASAALLVAALAAISGRTPVLRAESGGNPHCEDHATKACVLLDGSNTLTPNKYCDAGSCATCVPTSVRCNPFGSGVNNDNYWNEGP